MAVVVAAEVVVELRLTAAAVVVLLLLWVTFCWIMRWPSAVALAARLVWKEHRKYFETSGGCWALRGSEIS